MALDIGGEGTRPWQYLPNRIMDAEKRKATAQAWHSRQRSILADDWAGRRVEEETGLMDRLQKAGDWAKRKMEEANDFVSEWAPYAAIGGVAAPVVRPAIEKAGEFHQKEVLPRVLETEIPAPGGFMGQGGIAPSPTGQGVASENPWQKWEDRPYDEPTRTVLEMGGDPLNIAPIPGPEALRAAAKAPELAQGLIRGMAEAAPEVGRLGRQLATEELGAVRLPGRTPALTPPKGAGIQQGWDRARNVIASQGPAGQKLAAGLQEARDIAETTAGKWVSAMPTVRELTKAEFAEFVDVAEGTAKTLNTKVAKAASEWANIRDEVYNAAKTAKLDIGKLQDYFPHRYSPEMFKGDNWTRNVEHLVKSGQAATEEQAAQMLRRASDVWRNRRQGNLEVERIVDLPGYEKTKDALFGYIEGAAKRIADVQTFGKNDSKAMSLISKIGKEGGDASAAKNLFDISIGAKKYGEISEQIGSIMRAYSTFTKLGLGALTNASQSVNTATVTGGLRTLLKTPKAAFSPEAKDFALRAGVTLDGVIRDLRSGGGFSGKLAGIGAPGFNEVEKFNRTLAAWVGKDYAEQMAARAVTGSKGAVTALEKMGLDVQAIVNRGGQLTEPEQIQAARNIVERTQFKVDPQDLPGWASSPMGRLVSQFRTFSYNQSAFIGREILQPAMKGDIKPLVRFLVYGLPVGVAEVELQNFLRNRPSEEDPVQAIRQYYQRIGGIGILGEVLAGLAPPNSKYLPGERYALQAASLAAGPTLGTALEGIGSIPSALQGKPENLERFLLKQVPIVGPTLKNTLIPYKPGGRAGGGLTPLEKRMQGR